MTDLDRNALFCAFLVGFEQSAEGFNGEYTSPRRYPTWEAFEQKMREKFDKWMETGEFYP